MRSCFCFVTEKIPRTEFTKEYPKASLQEFSGEKDRNMDWSEQDMIRIAEYFKVVTEKSKLYLQREPFTGQEFITAEKHPEMEVINTRTVEKNHIEWYKTNGREILEGPVQWPGKWIPVIDVYGKEFDELPLDLRCKIMDEATLVVTIKWQEGLMRIQEALRGE